jgi:hypothetical protein
MHERWVVVERLISELGAVCALEIEASAFPELAAGPEVEDVRAALEKATDAVARATACGEPRTLDAARKALADAEAAAGAARLLLARARAARNRAS